MYKVMIVSAYEKNRAQFHKVISQLEETPTHLLVTDTDTVAIEWANYQSPTVRCLVSNVEVEVYGRTAQFKEIADRLEQADAVVLLGDSSHKKFTETLEKAAKMELPVYRI
jgi:hypothetical protein